MSGITESQILDMAAKKLAAQSRRVGDCIEFTGATRFGYGEMRVFGRRERVNRWAYEIANGPIPGELIVRHKCDNRPCINPDHLELGTRGDNARDMSERGRSLFGTRHKSAKMTDDIVRDILTRLAAGETQVALAAEYGVSQPTVGRVACNQTWKHISRDLDKEVAA